MALFKETCLWEQPLRNNHQSRYEPLYLNPSWSWCSMDACLPNLKCTQQSTWWPNWWYNWSFSRPRLSSFGTWAREFLISLFPGWSRGRSWRFRVYWSWAGTRIRGTFFSKVLFRHTCGSCSSVGILLWARSECHSSQPSQSNLCSRSKE